MRGFMLIIILKILLLQSTTNCVFLLHSVSVMLPFVYITIIKTQAMVMKMLAMATTVWSAEMARAMEVAV